MSGFEVVIMDANLCSFDTLFSRNLPHILEKIFLSLDYESFKNCLKVNSEWREFLASERFMTKFKHDIFEDERKLLVAAGQDNTEDIRALLSSGMVDVNCRDHYYTRFTSLHEASYRGIKDNVRLLLESGADPNMSDCWGRTPLYGAAHIGSSEVAQTLINAGADLNATDEDGRTALHEAVQKEQREVAQFLIENG